MDDLGDATYRNVIDELVDTCQRASAPPRWVDDGVWNLNASPDHLPEQHRITVLLQQLDRDDRVLLASLLHEAGVGGMHRCLAVLHELEVEPFDEAYEGAPFNDFVGRLGGWEWPSGPRSA